MSQIIPFDPTGRSRWALMMRDQKLQLNQLLRRMLQTAYSPDEMVHIGAIRQVLPVFRGNRRHWGKIREKVLREVLTSC